MFYLLIFFFFFFFFREEGRKRNINQLPPIHILTGTPTSDQTHNPGICPDWELNPQPFSVWDDAATN